MISFTAILKKFDKKGEKSGWTYIEVPQDVARDLKPDNKKGFRVKGTINAFSFESAALVPMGDGTFILAVNQAMRKGIHISLGGSVQVRMEIDTTALQLSDDFISCLKDEPMAFAHFKTLAPSHQRYFSNWIESAKTAATKAKRIAQSIQGLSMKLSYGEMIREHQAKNKDV